MSGNAGEPFALLLSVARASVPTPWNRRVLIDLSSAAHIGLGSVVGGGTTTLTLPIPGVPALKDTTLFLQSGIVRGGSVYLTNSFELRIE